MMILRMILIIFEVEIILKRKLDTYHNNQQITYKRLFIYVYISVCVSGFPLACMHFR